MFHAIALAVNLLPLDFKFDFGVELFIVFYKKYEGG